jgi:ribosomal-protein-alanine N-acetyltransferase
MTGPFDIREGDVGDAGRIAALFAFSDLPEWSEDSVASLLGGDNAICLAGNADGAFTGAIFGAAIAGEAEIYAIIVDPDWRRSGWGGALLDGFVRLCRALGNDAIHLEVAVDNTAARALYRRHGFAETGRRKGYYDRGNLRVDGLIMTLAL